ncbi:unnamed protein product [Camellia sinensis]
MYLGADPNKKIKSKSLRTKRKVSKVDQIVNRLKAKNKKTTPAQARVSTMQMADNIGSTSHTQAGIVNNISSKSLTVASEFVDFNIDADSNA